MTESRLLTWRGFLRVQHRLALEMLDTYGIRPERFRLISSSTNFIYLLTHKNLRLVLRLAFPGWRKLENARAEAAWLSALGRDTDIAVPRLLPTLNGETVARIEDRHAILMTWLPGMLLTRRLTGANLYKMGALFAQLHVHAAGWQPPAEFPNLTFNRYLSRGEPEALFAEDRLEGYLPGDLVLVRSVADRVNAHYAALDPSDLRVIHCDLWHDNIKLYRGELAPFDFEDTILGYRLHDIAMAMLDLAEDAGAAAYYDRLLPAFRAGYESLLPWPDGNLELLQMGRMLWKLNWFAMRRPDRFPDVAAFTANLFRRFEETGRLTEPLRPA